VKNQYFGDARDYLKYQLLEELLASVPGPDRLTCLWMLTAPDDTSEGNVHFVGNPELPDLTAFLRRHLDSGDRRVWHMREYFRMRGIAYLPWGDEGPYFTRERRDAYFRNIPTEHLHRVVVFFDPDNGLTARLPTPKHLSFDELAHVRNRTDDESMLVVYQHFQRKPRFWESMADEIRRRLGSPVGFVSGPGVALYVIPGNAGQIEAMNDALVRVAAAGRSRVAGVTSN
jgi:hypothetical protein